MPNPLIVGIIVFALVLAGAFAGWTIQQRLPKHHQTDATKNVVSVSMAVVATVSALVLGLLISNANTKFSVLEGEVTALSAEILRLDQILRRYGPDANPARETLREYAEQKTDDLFPKDPANVRLGNPSTYELLQRLEDLLLAMKPATPRDHWWLGQAMSLAANTTLADLFKLHVRTYPFVAVRASLRRHSSDESDDGVTDGRQAWLRRRSVDSFFPISLF